MKTLAAGLLALLVLGSCAEKRTDQTPSADTRKQVKAMQEIDVTTSRDFARKHTDLKSYWFAGLAELNRFELKQSRYGEIHDGEAVMVFVTEPFLPDKQVKQDSGNDPNAVQVLKTNFYRRFYTGIYPYTMLTSTFTPALQDGPTFKLAQSMQEWCGQVYAQLNLDEARTGYHGVSFSYFQSSGDQNFDMPTTLLEDDLYARIRLGPDKLPTGELQLLPAATYLRLAHKPWKVATATAELGAAHDSKFSDVPVRTYTLTYTAPAPRTLKIHFEAAFPYRIVGFEDTYAALFNPKGGEPQVLTTVGRLTNSIMLDYWSKHDNADAVWRDALGLQF